MFLLTRYSDVLGTQRIALADIYHNIGVIYDEQNRLNDALTFYDKSLRIREKIVGNSHPIVAMVYENMAQIFKDQGEFKKAVELQTKVIAIRKKHLGTNSIDYALALHNMGVINFKEVSSISQYNLKLTPSKTNYRKSMIVQ
jgi:tetratricopeptide (TPR) repeat protein